ncbi:Zn(II)2Cys6 transcription factor domain-containing protein [Aspergillus thermomutatus]|uniref:Zn(2)-C6 fungal-type domain-containing protein n=1 Tax=Aspergillus thermomutatus TaxID=41047 RepID=A0A397GEH3_ASPTH|nr:uncharacterized protein CDV56_106260 [Aspergillus thermomutatus]RHZ49402.1 hypothetical protein CDV56_106260 [Aspergillus thermomutatus]
MPRRSSSKMNKKGSKLDTRPYNQHASVFFRLPREIRDIIYGQILIFPVTVHLAYVGTKTRRFRSFLCQLSEDEQPEKRLHPLCRRCRVNHHRCSPRNAPTSFDVTARSSSEVRSQARVLALLRSCRRVYDETVDMLYRENTFYIENPRTLLELPSSLSRAGLSTFRHLYLESARYGEDTPSDRLARWAAVVRVLERLDGLETLVVILRPMFGLDWEVEALEKPLEAARLPVLRVLRDPVIRMAPAATAMRSGTARKRPSDADDHCQATQAARRRISRACDRCRAQKARCDGGKPCLRCGDLIPCVYQDKKPLRRKYPAGYVEMLEEHQAYLITGLRKLYERIQQDSRLPEVDRDGNNRQIVHELLDKLGIFEETIKERRSSMTGSEADDAQPSLGRIDQNDTVSAATPRLPESSRAWSSTQVKPSPAPNSNAGLNLPRAMTLPTHVPLNTGMAQPQCSLPYHHQADLAGLSRHQRPSRVGKDCDDAAAEGRENAAIIIKDYKMMPWTREALDIEVRPTSTGIKPNERSL